MNRNHAEVCSSAEWADHIHDDVLPRAIGDRRLGDEVLEIGPGYGAATEFVRRMATRLTAVEIDPDLAKPLAERYPEVSVLVGSAVTTGFETGSFDAVVCFTMLHHVPTPGLQDEIFAEAFRVLRPGGLFAGSDSMDSAGRRGFHVGDTFTPVDPRSLPGRLSTAGFADSDVEVHDGGDYFTFSAHRSP